MTVLVTIQHPAHVHFYRHAIDQLQADGEAVHVVARDNEVAVDLLERFDIDHEVLASASHSLAELALTQARYELAIVRYARRVDPDVITGIGGVAAAHAALLVDAESVVFTDTEHATLINTITHPVADYVVTPTCYTADAGDSQVVYRSYHELAYLHPDRFEPDPGVFEDLAVDPEDSFVVFRVSAWDSSHDVGASGIEDLEAAVHRLEATGATVLITSEVPLPDTLERCRTRVPPESMHHLLAYADLFFGEGATMASESAVLGTPAIYVNSLTMGYTDELDHEFGLLMNYNEADAHEAALRRAVSILEHEDDDRWERRRERLLAEKTDTTDVVLRLLEVARDGGSIGERGHTDPATAVAER